MISRTQRPRIVTVAVLGDAVAIARNAGDAHGVRATFAIAEKVVIRLVAHQVAARLPAEVGGRARVAPSIVREAAIFLGLLAILVRARAVAKVDLVRLQV